jgi:hypothetical protein
MKIVNFYLVYMHILLPKLGISLVLHLDNFQNCCIFKIDSHHVHETRNEKEDSMISQAFLNQLDVRVKYAMEKGWSHRQISISAKLQRAQGKDAEGWSPGVIGNLLAGKGRLDAPMVEKLVSFFNSIGAPYWDLDEAKALAGVSDEFPVLSAIERFDFGDLFPHDVKMKIPIFDADEAATNGFRSASVIAFFSLGSTQFGITNVAPYTDLIFLVDQAETSDETDETVLIVRDHEQVIRLMKKGEAHALTRIGRVVGYFTSGLPDEESR